MTTQLNTTIRDTDTADQIFSHLVRLHEGLDADQSASVNAELLILLANHIGQPAVISQAVDLLISSRA